MSFAIDQDAKPCTNSARRSKLKISKLPLSSMYDRPSMHSSTAPPLPLRTLLVEFKKLAIAVDDFLQDELDREAVAAEQAEIREALRTLDGAIDAAEKGTSAGADEAPDEAPELDRSLTGLEGLARPRTDEEPVFPKASELQWREEPLDSTPDIATSAEPASDSGRVQETGLAQLHPPAQQVHTSIGVARSGNLIAIPRLSLGRLASVPAASMLLLDLFSCTS